METDIFRNSFLGRRLRLIRSVLLILLLSTIQVAQTQDFGLQTQATPQASNYAQMLRDERVIGPFIGPIKAIHATSAQYTVVYSHIGDIYEGTHPMQKTIVADQSEYTFSEDGKLRSIDVNYQLQVGYFTYKTGDWLKELKKKKNYSSKLFDGIISYQFQDGRLVQKQDSVEGKMHNEVAQYDSLGRLVNYCHNQESSKEWEHFTYNNMDNQQTRCIKYRMRDGDTLLAAMEFFVPLHP